MNRVLYGATPADFTTSSTGRILPNVLVTVWTRSVGGEQVTDLTDIDGHEVATIVSDKTGHVRFYGPPGEQRTLWMQPATSPVRFAVRPTDPPIPTLTDEQVAELATYVGDLSNYPTTATMLQVVADALATIDASLISGTVTVGPVPKTASSAVGDVNLDPATGVLTQWDGTQWEYKATFTSGLSQQAVAALIAAAVDELPNPPDLTGYARLTDVLPRVATVADIPANARVGQAFLVGPDRLLYVVLTDGVALTGTGLSQEQIATIIASLPDSPISRDEFDRLVATVASIDLSVYPTTQQLSDAVTVLTDRITETQTVLGGKPDTATVQEVVQQLYDQIRLKADRSNPTQTITANTIMLREDGWALGVARIDGALRLVIQPDYTAGEPMVLVTGDDLAAVTDYLARLSLEDRLDLNEQQHIGFEDAILTLEDKKADRSNPAQEITLKALRTVTKDGTPGMVLRGYGLGGEPGLWLWGSDGKIVGKVANVNDLDTFARLDDPTQTIRSSALAVQAGIGFAGNLDDWLLALVDSPSFGKRLALLRTDDHDPDEVNHVVLRDDLVEFEKYVQGLIPKPGQWVPLPLRTEYVMVDGKRPYYRTLPNGMVQLIGEIKHRDNLPFPVDVYTPLLAPAGLPVGIRPVVSCSYVVPTYGGNPTGAHANLVIGQGGGISVNPKVTSPEKVELSGVYYGGEWPTTRGETA